MYIIFSIDNFKRNMYNTFPYVDYIRLLLGAIQAPNLVLSFEQNILIRNG